MIHDIAIYVAVFATGMLVGYLLKVVMVNKEKIKKQEIYGNATRTC